MKITGRGQASEEKIRGGSEEDESSSGDSTW